LPWLIERGKLASSKLSVFSKPTGSEPMRYDARVLVEDTKEVTSYSISFINSDDLLILAIKD
jgi:hypothetical protein